MSTTVALLLALLLLLANGFFVAVEFALIGTQRSQLEDKAKQGNRRARTAMAAITDLNTQIAGAQLGITMASIALGLIAEPSVAHLLEDTVLSGLAEGPRHTLGLIIALSFVTFLHILIGEMVPKNIALADAPATAMWLSPLHTLFVRIAGPFVWLLNSMANGVLRLMGITAVDERAQAKTPEELAMLLEEAHGDAVLDDDDFGLLSGTLELGGASIREAIVPWADVDRAPAAAPIAEVEARMAASGHSRLVLVGDDDEPMGWCHAKDLLAVDHNHWDEPLPQHRRRRFILVDQDMAAEDALERMQAERAHFVLATAGDEPVGLLTIEDVLEVIVSGLAKQGEG
ncbi:MAG: hemolysin family protein [Actinomycetota bacterium]